MKRNNRMTRVNDEITKELANIIRGELKDPRIGVMTSVLRVETTQDLKYCKIFISVLGNDEEKKGSYERAQKRFRIYKAPAGGEDKPAHNSGAYVQT